VNECAEARLNNCSPNAKCIDKAVGYTCRCVPGFVDTSPEGARQPGRICTQCGSYNDIPLIFSKLLLSVVNECATKQHDCDANAICRDEPIGYRCQCPFGFADASKNPSKPGRLCVQRKLFVELS
ncbi:calcium binding EGF domain protein, partial [Teladorsagia circumcincta]